MFKNYVVLACVIIFLACNSDRATKEGTIQGEKLRQDKKMSQFLSNFDSIPSFKKDGWIIENAAADESFQSYRISNKFGNIEHVVDLMHIIDIDQEAEYIITDYYLYTSTSGYRHFLKLENGLDTLYHYKKMQKDSSVWELKNLEFVVGKYFYLFESRMLTPEQGMYFIKHKDSLMKVKGNDLLPLPGVAISN